MLLVSRSLACIALVAASVYNLPGTQASAAATAACPLNCTTEYSPVCGSDGKTYGNKCELERAQCTNTSLTLKSSGECPSTGTSRPSPTTSSPSPSVNSSSSGGSGACDIVACPAIWSPVCGSDGKTYGNDCDLRLAKCTNKSLTVASNGECPGGSVGGSSNGPGGEDISGSVGAPASSSSTTDPNDTVETPKPETTSDGSVSSAASAGALVVATSALYLLALAE